MSAKMQLTRQREAVLAVVQQAEKHLTAQEVYDRVRQQLTGIAYGTVYNALSYLAQAGLIQIVNVGGEPALYDRNTSRHDHLVCRQCGKVLDYSFLDLEQARQHIASDTGFRVEKIQALFVGLCPDCQRQR
jgi:Fur family peroxide stress response transcriptional regulator